VSLLRHHIFIVPSGTAQVSGKARLASARCAAAAGRACFFPVSGHLP
jgi:hypothetical protein